MLSYNRCACTAALYTTARQPVKVLKIQRATGQSLPRLLQMPTAAGEFYNQYI
jgi:hypothetical protein